MVILADHQVLPIISTLRADLVSHREMAIRKWYAGSSNWYYHRRALPGEYDCSRRFYQLIDPQLRGLCRLLHRYGIHTTPSCQGHFYGRDYFERIWDALVRERDLIQTTGLKVRESSEGREFLFRACTYELPWPNFNEFYSLASTTQTQGYLGILLPREQHALVCELHNHPFHTERAAIHFDGDLSCLLGGSVFGVTVQPRDPAERDRLWQSVVEYLHAILSRVHAHGRTTPIRRVAGLR